MSEFLQMIAGAVFYLIAMLAVTAVFIFVAYLLVALGWPWSLGVIAIIFAVGIYFID